LLKTAAGKDGLVIDLPAHAPDKLASVIRVETED